MIQRIQSLYLLLITALLIAVLFLPFGFLQTPAEMYEYTAFSIQQVLTGEVYALPVWILAAVLIISAALSFLTIFLYKKRKVQIRLCLCNELVLVLFYLIYAIFLFMFISKTGAENETCFGMALPLISIILNYMAVIAIRKDEALVKSWDRIR
ncbi:MAG: DUF4293 domain-containing protein [Bacteroidales bacterium]|nr:DUF4293 domain-containing protein [Bacteroidales bacterium]MDD3908040.1 DUF4293 domain-containing protein [Bacteroidales bacterium]MDD4712757.1 DUF4293 domain-containing protein [Bacteroidales bacterium]